MVTTVPALWASVWRGLQGVKMLMSVMERGQDHVVSMPAALIPPALTPVAVSVVT